MVKKEYPLHDDIKRALLYVMTRGTYKPFELYKEAGYVLEKWGLYGVYKCKKRDMAT